VQTKAITVCSCATVSEVVMRGANHQEVGGGPMILPKPVHSCTPVSQTKARPR
jgi:hypothetical protein